MRSLDATYNGSSGKAQWRNEAFGSVSLSGFSDSVRSNSTAQWRNEAFGSVSGPELEHLLRDVVAKWRNEAFGSVGNTEVEQC